MVHVEGPVSHSILEVPEEENRQRVLQQSLLFPIGWGPRSTGIKGMPLGRVSRLKSMGGLSSGLSCLSGKAMQRATQSWKQPCETC
jgi:hypothetical protein